MLVDSFYKSIYFLNIVLREQIFASIYKVYTLAGA